MTPDGITVQPRNRFDRMEIAGAFGDLGTLVPFVVAYMGVLKMDPFGVLLAFGVAMLICGFVYRTPIPVQPMKAVGAICYRHFLRQTNVLFIIGGKSNNTDILETFRGMGDALREHFAANGPTPLYVVVGRGGPNLVRGFGALADACDSVGVPYRFFGFDSAISEVVNYAKRIDEWMKGGGRDVIARHLGIAPTH